MGAEFPDLGGAPSTAQYLEGEQRLIRAAFPELAGQRLLKTDLWDEARNTRILQWAGEQGAEVHGIDISTPTLLSNHIRILSRPPSLDTSGLCR